MENGLNKRNKVSDLLCMLPVFVFTLSILLVHLHLFSMPMTDIYWSEATDTSTITDVFGYWKAIAIIGSAGLAVIIFLIAYFKDLICIKKSFLYIPALVYAGFVLISLCFSDYKYFALRGMSEHFEGTLVLLAYVILILFLANVVDSERRLRLVVYCALGAAFVLGILGITQATGHDFLSTVTGQKMITPNYVLENGVKSWDMIDILAESGQKAYDFSFTDGQVYQTVYNINYVPLYLSLLIPVSAILFVAFGTSESKIKNRLSFIFLVSYGLYLYNFFAANSASGYFGLAAIFISALIIFHKYLKEWIKPIICLVLVLGLVLGLTVSYWLPDIRSTVQDVSQFLITRIYADNTDDIKLEYDNPPGGTWAPIDYIETCGDYMLFSINGNALKFVRDFEHSAYTICDINDQQVYIKPIEWDQSSYEILDDRFHDYLTLSLRSIDGEMFLDVITSTLGWRFIYGPQGFRYRNAVGKNVELYNVPHANIIKNYSAGTNRGLIWDTTIPMLKKYVLKGAGADVFTFVYPQNDYVTIYNSIDRYHMNLVVDKVHNIYMQYWVNTGLVSLLAWLVLIGYYFVGAVKGFRKRGFVDFVDFVNGGIFCGIIGFLFVAFFNDGSVNTMPMFYTMLGTGLALNMKDRWTLKNEASGRKQASMPEI